MGHQIGIVPQWDTKSDHGYYYFITIYCVSIHVPYGWNEMQYPNLGNFFCNEDIELELRSFYGAKYMI